MLIDVDNTGFSVYSDNKMLNKIFSKNSRIDIITGLLFALTIFQGSTKHFHFPAWAMVGDEFMMILIAIFTFSYFLLKERPPKGWLLPLIPFVSVLLSWIVSDRSVLSLAYSFRAFFIFVPAMWWGYIHYRLPVREEDAKAGGIPANLRRIMNIIGVVFVIQLPVIAYQVVQMINRGVYSPDAVYGLFSDSNNAGYFVNLFMFLVLAVWLDKKGKLLTSVLAISFFGLLLFEARAAVFTFLAYLIFAIVYRTLWQKKDSIHAIVFLVVAFVAATIYSSFFNENIFSLLNWGHFVKIERSVEAGANRFLWIDKTWNQLTVTHPDKLWLGFGPGNHSTYYAITRGAPIWKSELYDAFGQIEKGQDTGVDSQIIPVAGEFGVIGLIAFYGVWVWYVFGAISIKRFVDGLGTNEIAAGGLITFWLVNSYTNHIWELPSLALGFFFFLGMTMREARPHSSNAKGVLFFVHSFWPMNGGVEQQALRQAKGLRARGFDVRVLTAKHKKGLKSYEIVDSVPIYRFWYPYWVPFKPLRKFLNVIAGAVAFSQMPSKFKFRLLHIHQLQWFTIVGYLFKQKYGYKILGKGTSSGYRSDGLKFYDTLSILKIPAKRVKLRERVYHSIDKVICISRIMIDELVYYGVPRENVTYIPNGIPLPIRGNVGTKKERAAFSIISSMRFVPVKNPQLHVNAAVILHKKYPKLPFIYTIFGPGEFLEESREIVRKNNATDYIKLPGATPNSDVLAELAQADLFLNISLSEGLSNSVLESMSLGVPMLISNVGGAGDLIGNELPNGTKKEWKKCANGGLVLPDISADALAEVLHEMLGDKEYLHKAGKNARALIEKEFALEIVLDKYEGLYKQLLAK